MAQSEKVALLHSIAVADTSTTTDSAAEVDNPSPDPRHLRRHHSLPHTTYYNTISHSLPPRRLSTPRPPPTRPPSLRRRVRTAFTTGAILCTVLLERVSYFSIVGNLVLFCTNFLAYDSATAVTLDLVFIGVCYTVPLVGGRIADLIAGRFNTIFGSFLILITGISLLPAVAFDYVKKFGSDPLGYEYQLPLAFKRGYFLLGIALCGIGFGGLKANISPLGAQQVEWFGEEAIHSFFNWFYWFINVGGCIAYLLVIGIQQEIGFDVGYLIPALTVVAATIIFFLPRNYYREHPGGSLVGRVMHVLWYGTIGCKSSSRSKDSSRSATPVSEESFAVPSEFLDRARMSCGGEFDDAEVDEVKSVMLTVPIFMSLIIFSAVTAQTTTTMLLQGERMDSRLNGGYIVPAASLNFVKMAIITILIPLLDRIVYPLMGRFGRKPTLLQRIGFGMVLGVLAMVATGVVEIVRKQDMAVHGGLSQNVSGVVYNASYTSLFWQTPQFGLIGAAEAFTLVTALEFAYTESPVAMQGMVMGMNHVTTGLGALLASAIYNAIAAATNAQGNPWLPDEINLGHLDWFSFVLASILLLNLVAFVLVARCYNYNSLGIIPPTPGTPFNVSSEFPRSVGRPSNGPLLVPDYRSHLTSDLLNQSVP